MSKLIKNTALYTFGNLIPKAASFILLPLYTRVLTPEDYGIVGGLGVVSMIVIILFSLAMDRSVFRLYWDYKSEEEKRDYLGSVTLALWGIASVMLILLLFPLRPVIASVYKSIPFFPYYIYVLVTGYGTVFGLIPKAYMRIRQNAKLFVGVSLAQFFINTALIIWFVLVRKEGAAGMLKGQMWGVLLTIPFYLVFSLRIMNLKVLKPVLKSSLIFSLPVIPGLLSGWVLGVTDRIFIERYFSLADLGIYSLGYKIAGLALILSGAFQQAYTPLFYEVAAGDNQPEARQRLSRYNNTYVFLILLVCFFISLFAREVIGLLLDSRYQNAYQIVPIIALAYLINIVSGLFNMAIYQQKKTLWTMWVQIFAAGLNVGLNALMVPAFGAFGAAWATVLVSLISATIRYRMAWRLYHIPMPLVRIFWGGAACAAILLGCEILPVGLYVSFFIKLGISLLLVAVVGSRYKGVLMSWARGRRVA